MSAKLWVRPISLASSIQCLLEGLRKPEEWVVVIKIRFEVLRWLFK